MYSNQSQHASSPMCISFSLSSHSACFLHFPPLLSANQSTFSCSQTAWLAMYQAFLAIPAGHLFGLMVVVVTILDPIFHFLPFTPTYFVLSVTHFPLIPSHTARTATQSPDKSPDESPDHSTVYYHMLLLCSPQFPLFAHYRLPAHDVLSTACQLMMGLYLDCQLIASSLTAHDVTLLYVTLLFCDLYCL